MKKFVWIGVALLSAACGVTARPPLVVPPTPALTRMLVPVHDAAGNLPTNLVGTLTPWDGSPAVVGLNTPDGALFVTASAGGSTVCFEADGFARTCVDLTIAALAPGVTLKPPFPSAPTRQQVLTMKVGMYGNTCNVPELGGMIPWWDPGAQALSAERRADVYACKHAFGDAGIIIGSGEYEGILYDEPDNPYQVAIHPYDIAARVVEAAQNGYMSKIILDGDGATMQRAFDEFPRVYAKLLHGGPNGEDLNRFVQYVPGWDGVFYSCTDVGCWTPALIQQWAAQARALCAYCVLGLEFNTGHIPFGEGDGDYRPGGGMKDFDSVLIEFDFNLHNDNTWQIVSRLIGPAYNKPADDPNGAAPWYMASPTMRGPWGVECFEPPTYLWVRQRVSPEQAAADRAYLVALGCPVVD